MTMIDHIVTVVPAHDESGRLGACLDAIDTARLRLDGTVDVSVVVVADACTDATAAVARLRLRRPSDRVVITTHRCAGAARRDGAIAALASVGGPDGVWMASTDADTIVPADWFQTQLRWAYRGLDGVAGIVSLHDDDDCGPLLQHRFETYYRTGPHGRHGHIHGANMGVRADAFVAVGGWRPLATGEDQDLWRRLGDAGHHLLGTTDLTVSTSARRRARAPHGFAADLVALDRAVA